VSGLPLLVDRIFEGIALTAVEQSIMLLAKLLIGRLLQDVVGRHQRPNEGVHIVHVSHARVTPGEQARVGKELLFGRSRFLPSFPRLTAML
jgi:hypothetical protein